jgi:hypothetical protein
MVNEYVDFVSDEEFLECVKLVVDAYVEEIDLQKNIIDPFKVAFDSYSKELTQEEWIEGEEIRQKDKTINNKIGDFHQKLLGKSEGWVDLGTGDISKVDLKKQDNSVFIELKNKHNTVNADSKMKCRDKLIILREQFPDSICYFSYIVPANGKSEDRVWKLKGEENPDVNLRILTGKKVYELVTGDSESLVKVFNALPKAIKNLLKLNNEFSDSEKDRIKSYLTYAFRKS